MTGDEIAICSAAVRFYLAKQAVIPYEGNGEEVAQSAEFVLLATIQEIETRRGGLSEFVIATE